MSTFFSNAATFALSTAAAVGGGTLLASPSKSNSLLSYCPDTVKNIAAQAYNAVTTRLLSRVADTPLSGACQNWLKNRATNDFTDLSTLGFFAKPLYPFYAIGNAVTQYAQSQQFSIACRTTDANEFQRTARTQIKAALLSIEGFTPRTEGVDEGSLSYRINSSQPLDLQKYQGQHPMPTTRSAVQDALTGIAPYAFTPLAIQAIMCQNTLYRSILGQLPYLGVCIATATSVLYYVSTRLPEATRQPELHLNEGMVNFLATQAGEVLDFADEGARVSYVNLAKARLRRMNFSHILLDKTPTPAEANPFVLHLEENAAEHLATQFANVLSFTDEGAKTACINVAKAHLSRMNFAPYVLGENLPSTDDRSETLLLEENAVDHLATQAGEVLQFANERAKTSYVENAKTRLRGMNFAPILLSEVPPAVVNNPANTGGASRAAGESGHIPAPTTTTTTTTTTNGSTAAGAQPAQEVALDDNFFNGQLDIDQDENTLQEIYGTLLIKTQEMAQNSAATPSQKAQSHFQADLAFSKWLLVKRDFDAFVTVYTNMQCYHYMSVSNLEHLDDVPTCVRHYATHLAYRACMTAYPTDQQKLDWKIKAHESYLSALGSAQSDSILFTHGGQALDIHEKIQQTSRQLEDARQDRQAHLASQAERLFQENALLEEQLRFSQSELTNKSSVVEDLTNQVASLKAELSYLQTRSAQHSGQQPKGVHTAHGVIASGVGGGAQTVPGQLTFTQSTSTQPLPPQTGDVQPQPFTQQLPLLSFPLIGTGQPQPGGTGFSVPVPQTPQPGGTGFSVPVPQTMSGQQQQSVARAPRPSPTNES